METNKIVPNSVDLDDTDFNIKVGLVERKVVFQDKKNNIQFVINYSFVTTKNSSI